MFTPTVLAIPVLTMCLPLAVGWLHRRYPRLIPRAGDSWLPILAGALFIASFFLPDIHISRETDTFQQHFVGGGFYCTLLFVYFQKIFGWRWKHWLTGFVFLFAWASALGVANELLEFTVTKLNITHIDIYDTDWDLLANTLGALSSYALYCLFARTKPGTD